MTEDDRVKRQRDEERDELRRKLNKCLVLLGTKSEASNQSGVANEAYSQFLKTLLDNAHVNFDKQKGGNRYTDKDLKSFATYVFLTGGRKTYEALQKNLKGCLPSIRTIERFIQSTGQIITEGQFRFAELQQYLQEHEYPLQVSKLPRSEINIDLSCHILLQGCCVSEKRKVRKGYLIYN